MNPAASILLGMLAGAGAGFLAGSFASEEPTQYGTGVEAAEAQMQRLESEIRELRELMKEPRGASVEPRERTAAEPEPDVEALIDAWMTEHLAERVGDLVGEAGVAAEDGPGAITTTEEAILALQNAEDWDAQMAALAAAQEAGILDEVIAELERRAESQPDSESAQMELAAGYMQKLFSTTNPIETGTWAMKLDQTYDKALTINDQSWDARFGKAMSLSNWPDFTGKKAEAIRQFEILREQQRSAPNGPGYDQTYLILGNMYQQQGQADKARAAWQEGLDRYPDHAQLREQLNGGN